MVVVRGPDTDITVRRRDRVAGIWINRDAANLSRHAGLLLPRQHAGRSKAIAPPRTLARYGIGLENLEPDAVHSHHDYEPFRQAALRHLIRDELYTEAPGGVEFLSEHPVPRPCAGAGGRGARANIMSRSICSATAR